MSLYKINMALGQLKIVKKTLVDYPKYTMIISSLINQIQEDIKSLNEEKISLLKNENNLNEFEIFRNLLNIEHINQKIRKNKFRNSPANSEERKELARDVKKYSDKINQMEQEFRELKEKNRVEKKKMYDLMRKSSKKRK